jgi:hypothetical protein
VVEGGLGGAGGVGGDRAGQQVGQGGVVAADGHPAFGHVAVEGAAEGVGEAGEVGELLVDVVGVRVHAPILKQRLLDSRPQQLYNKETLLIEEESAWPIPQPVSPPPPPATTLPTRPT